MHSHLVFLRAALKESGATEADLTTPAAPSEQEGAGGMTRTLPIPTPDPEQEIEAQEAEGASSGSESNKPPLPTLRHRLCRDLSSSTSAPVYSSLKWHDICEN